MWKVPLEKREFAFKLDMLLFVGSFSFEMNQKKRQENDQITESNGLESTISYISNPLVDKKR